MRHHVIATRRYDFVDHRASERVQQLARAWLARRALAHARHMKTRREREAVERAKWERAQVERSRYVTMRLPLAIVDVEEEMRGPKPPGASLAPRARRARETGGRYAPSCFETRVPFGPLRTGVLQDARSVRAVAHRRASRRAFLMRDTRSSRLSPLPRRVDVPAARRGLGLGLGRRPRRHGALGRLRAHRRLPDRGAVRAGRPAAPLPGHDLLGRADDVHDERGAQDVPQGDVRRRVRRRRLGPRRQADGHPRDQALGRHARRGPLRRRRRVLPGQGCGAQRARRARARLPRAVRRRRHGDAAARQDPRRHGRGACSRSREMAA